MVTVRVSVRANVRSGGCTRICGRAVGVVDRRCSMYNVILAKFYGGLGLKRVKVRVFMDVGVLLEMAAVVMEAFELVPQIRPDESSNICSLFAVEVLHAPQSVRAKDNAPTNICFMLVTWDTSHLDMRRLNDGA